MAPETGKQRRARIEHGYYRRPDRLVRVRNGLTLVAVVIACGWFILAPHWDRHRVQNVSFFQWDRMASPGPLNASHAMWDADCQKCHTPFSPINASQWTPALATTHRQSDENCSACHRVSIHSPKQHPAEVMTCAECHRDHQGRDASLVSRDDRQCTRCHAQIASHATNSILADVRQFSTPGHPAFSPSSDGANAVAFNHALHLSKGLTQTPDAAPFTWERLPPEERRRYGLSADTPATTPVQLACADCHRIEPDARARMTPPRYQEDCRACHPLGFDPKHAELQIPHGLQVDQVVAKLQETFAARAVLESPATLKAALSATQRWLPGHGDPADPTVAQAIDRNVGDALRLLFQASAQGTSRRGCVGCHTFDPGLPTVPSPKSLSGVRVRSVHRDRPWFSSGVFNHKAHRSSQCTECHAAAGTSEKSDDILLPSIDTCLKCHDAASRRSSPGGASSACVECHRYHPPALTSADTLGAPPDPVEVPQR